MYRKSIGAVLGALAMAILSGCTIVPAYPNQYIVPAYPNQYYGAGGGHYPPAVAPTPMQPHTVAKPAETRRIPGKVEFVPLVPITGTAVMIPHESGKPLPPDPGLRAFTIPADRQVYGEMMRGGGRWQAGYFRAGEVVWARDAGMAGEYRRYTPVRLDRCRNALRGFEIREYPERVETHSQEVVEVPVPVPQPYPVAEPYPVPMPQQQVPMGIGGGCRPQYQQPRYQQPRRSYRSTRINVNRNVNRNVNINRGAPMPQYQPRPAPRPAPVQRGYCPPGRPAGR